MPRLSLERLYVPEAAAMGTTKAPNGAGPLGSAPLKVSFAGLPPYDPAAGIESRAELIQAKQAGGLTARELRTSSQQTLKSGSLSARGWNDSTDSKPSSYDGKLPSGLSPQGSARASDRPTHGQCCLQLAQGYSSHKSSTQPSWTLETSSRSKQRWAGCCCHS